MRTPNQFRIQLRKNIYEFEHTKTYQLFTTALIIAVSLLGLAITFGNSNFFGFLAGGAFFSFLVAKNQQEKSVFLTQKVRQLVQMADPAFDLEKELKAAT